MTEPTETTPSQSLDADLSPSNPASPSHTQAEMPEVATPHRARNSKIFLAFTAVPAVIGLAVYFMWPKALPPDPLQWAPSASLMVASIDVDAIRASHAYQSVVARFDDANQPEVVKTCGFHPLDMVHRGVVFVLPDDSGRPERFGLVARGDLEHERIVQCVEKIVKGNGGSPRQVEIDGVKAVAGRGESRSAFFGTDGALIGTEASLRGAIGALRDSSRSARAQPEIATLWEELGYQKDLVAVSKLPAAWKKALAQILLLRGGADKVELAGAAVSVRSGLQASVMLTSRDAATLEAIKTQVRARTDAFLREPIMALSPMGTALRRVDVEVTEGRVLATLNLTDSQLDTIVNTLADIYDAQAAAHRERAQRSANPDGVAPASSPPTQPTP